MKRRSRRGLMASALALAGAALPLAAQAAPASSGSPGSPAAPAAPPPAPMPPMPPGPRTGLAAAPGQRAVTLEELRAAVLADAAAQWPQVDRSTLQVVVAEEVTWADGSLGCATPGLNYTQALVPGWRLVVSDGRRQLNYHASRRGAWVLCPAGRAARPLPGAATR